jgi:ABC-type ATPase with predicted acetyltransferase domain
MSKKAYRERECIHREKDVEGDFYRGLAYIKALQRLSSDEAVKIARRVEQFYWSDAENVFVWLCNDCAKTLHLYESSPTFSQITQQTPQSKNT